MQEKAVIYARVSSKEQEKEGFSIPAQKKLLKEYADKNDFQVINIFQESASAKEAGREEFNEMLKLLKKDKTIKHLLVEKNDRLMRNEADFATVIELATKIRVNVHLVKDNMILNEYSAPQELFMFSINSAMSSFYSRNLGREIKKGLVEKAEQGYWPNKPPYGYKRTYNSRDMEINETEAKFVKKAYELYSTGELSLESVVNKLYDLGYIYKPHKPKIQKGPLEKILKNPIYKGLFKYDKVVYIGNYEPIIENALYEKVQKAFKRMNKPEYTSKEFLFSGLITCSECGCAIVSEIKKGKYIYYHCTWGKGKDKCNQLKYIPQAKIEEQIIEALQKIKITTGQKEWIKKAIIVIDKKQQEHSSNKITQYQADIKKKKDQLHKIYNDKLEGLIDDEFWIEQHNKLKVQIERYKSLIDAFDKAEIKSMEEMSGTLELLESLVELYLEEDDEQKKKIVKSVLSNLTLKDGKLSYDYVKPFDLFAKGLSCHQDWSVGDSNP